MPTTLATTTDKTKVRKAVPTSVMHKLETSLELDCEMQSNGLDHKVLMAAVARLYVASPDARQWTYTQLWGAAALLKDAKKNNSYFIRLIDIEHSEGIVIWEQELYSEFQFHKDAPFFYTFDTDEYLAGLEFVDQEEGEIFYRKMERRGTAGLSKNQKTKSSGSGASHFLRSSFRRKTKITKESIGKPEDFTHIAHIGYETEKGFNINGKNSNLVKELQALGISESEIEQNKDFIQDYLQQHGSRGSGMVRTTEGNKRPPPPPPPPRRIRADGAPLSPSTLTLPPPLDKTLQHVGSVPPPPPPPPLPVRHPPHQASSPLTPRHPPTSLVGNGDIGRTNLMASIRETGGFASLKQHHHPHLDVTTEEEKKASQSDPATATPIVTTPNLAASLADVLHQRKMAMGSDEDFEEEDDDDDDWD